MAFNIFDSLSGQASVNNFLWKQAPQKPDFMSSMQLQAPRTSSYVAPKKTPIQAVSKQSSIFLQANAWDPIVSDDEISQMMKSWASDSEIEMMITEMEKERSWNKQEPQAGQIEQSGLDQALSWVEYVWEWIQNITGGAISEVPNVLGNTASFMNDMAQYNPVSYIGGQIGDIAKSAFTDSTYWQARDQRSKANDKLSTQLKWAGETGKKFVQKYGSYDPESTGAKVWETGTDIAATIIWPWKFFKTAEKANVAIRTLAWAWNVSIQWTTAAVSNYVATEWRMPTAKEVGLFVAVQWWGKVIGWALEKIKTIPVSKLIPTTITQAWKDFVQWLEVGKAVSTTGISFTKWQLVKKIENKITGLSWKIDTAIDTTIKTLWDSPLTIKNITKWMKEKLMSDPSTARKLQGTPIDMQDISDWIDETVTAYTKLYWAKKLWLNDQQKLKKDIYSWIANVFSKPTTAKLSARQITEKQIAKTLKEWLEEKIPQIKQLNKDLAPFLAADKRLKAKWDYSGYLTDLIAWWIASGNPMWIIDDPTWFMKNFVSWVLLKRVWTSTLAKTTASTILAKAESLFNNKEFQKYLMNEARLRTNNE